MTQTLLGDQSQDEPSIDINKDYFAELVGDGKKFKDPQALARAKAESDAYIRTLTTQMDAMREDYTKVRDELNAVPKLQELIDQMSTQQNLNTNVQNPPIVPQPQYDPEKIKSLVSSQVQEMRMTEKQEQNFESVRAALATKWGANHSSVLKEKMKELDVSEEYINDQARRFPKALLKALGVDETSSGELFQTPMKSTQRTDNFAPSTSKRTWSFYQKMRKDSPTEYYNPKTQVQMHKDYELLGTAFEDGDFSN